MDKKMYAEGFKDGYRTGFKDGLSRIEIKLTESYAKQIEQAVVKEKQLESAFKHCLMNSSFENAYPEQ